MDKFNGVGYGIPTLGRKLKAFTAYARKQRNLHLLERIEGGERLVSAVTELIRAFDAFDAPFVRGIEGVVVAKERGGE
jgi:hypothetical protein